MSVCLFNAWLTNRVPLVCCSSEDVEDKQQQLSAAGSARVKTTDHLDYLIIVVHHVGLTQTFTGVLGADHCHQHSQNHWIRIHNTREIQHWWDKWARSETPSEEHPANPKWGCFARVRVRVSERATAEEGVATPEGGRSGRGEAGRGERRGSGPRGGGERSVHDMNEPCSVTEG